MTAKRPRASRTSRIGSRGGVTRSSGTNTPLRLENVRDTAKRRVVLEAFERGPGHGTFEALLAAARRLDPSIGTATVYRTLRLLLEQQLAVERHFEGQPTQYEHADRGHHHHDHLICRVCGRIVEFEEPKLEQLQEEVARRYGFELRGHQHELYGVCSACPRAPNGPGRM